MRIAIDVTRAVIETAGIGRYTREITKSILKNDKKNKYLLFSTHYKDSAQKESIINEFKGNNVETLRIKIPGKMKELLWEMPYVGVGKYIKSCDLLFAPSFFEVDLSLKIPQIVTIHDLTMRLFPEQRGTFLSRYLTRRTRLACKKAKKVICVSQSTKNDLIALDNRLSNKVEVVYPGYQIFKEMSPVLPAGLKKDKFLLSVGTIEPRKNIINLLRAYNMLSDEIKNQYPLVIAGGKGWNNSNVFKELKKLKLEGKVIFLGFVKDNILARLYADCRAFSYVSIYEGFGLPIIEALSFNKPVLTSNVSSMPEAGGKASIIVDPDNIKQISSGLRKILIEERERSNLIKNSEKQTDKFSWDKASKETLEVFEEVND